MIINTRSWHYKVFSLLWNKFGDKQTEKPSTLVDYILFNACGISTILFFFLILGFAVGTLTITIVGLALGDPQKTLDFFLVKDTSNSTIKSLSLIICSLIGLPVLFLIKKICNYVVKILNRVSSIKIEYK